MLAAACAARNPERGFALLRELVSSGRARRGWRTLGNQGPGRLWQTLSDIDRERAIRTLLSGGADAVPSGLPKGIIVLDKDAGLLRKIARESAETALAVASILYPIGTAEYWRAGAELVDMYPESDGLKGLLGYRGQSEGGFRSNLSAASRGLAATVQAVASEKGRSSVTRTWLTDLARALEQDANGWDLREGSLEWE